MKKSFSLKLTESAILVAFAIVLSFVKIVDLPFGGSITAFSMLPIIIVAYRNGTGWGILSAVAYSLIQLLSGMKNLSYATSTQAVIAIILLDYIIAFTVLGLGGIFKKTFKNQGTALVLGVVLTGILRYICHIISGCTVWAGLSIPDTESLIYSIAYNGTYMIPEIIICAFGAYYISKFLSFKSDVITRTDFANENKKSDMFSLLNGISITSILAMIVWDIKEIAFCLQNEETGDFDVTGFANVNWISVIIATLICIVLFVAFRLLAQKFSDNKTSLKGLFICIPFGAAILALCYDVFYILDVFGKATAEKPVSQYAYFNIIILSVAAIALFIFGIAKFIKNKKEN